MEIRSARQPPRKWPTNPSNRPLQNKDKDYEYEEVKGSPEEKEYEGCDNNHKDDVLNDVEEQEEDAPAAYKGEYYSSEDSETSNNFKEEDVKELQDEDNNEEDDGTGIKDFDINGNGDKDTNAGGGHTEWLRFLIPKART